MTELKVVEDGGGLMTMQEASDYLKIKVSTLYDMCMRKKVPVVKIGRLNRFKLSDLEAFINRNRQEAN
ncbi:MAG: helix-turn-helix domain-containing protein [Candidatus Brocadia sp.]|jgi:DNA binding domain, excisionase family|uniref:Phage transcriptional regulator n=1 Tax=Candidatus Brocadia fulgida TaxID=380242 RepID=A0A0M2UVF6_9BACT|nr:MAG: putative phage transcriptional regulator [Candidatus Brocadia fulgida]UJS21344.1 MAG: helix-turn-helix domain-containing protein [Candidatus Brocadia sp.]